MPLQLEDIKCFYNYKAYSISIMRSGHPTLRLEPNQEVIDSKGNYVVNEWLLECSTQNQLGRKMKTTADRAIVTEKEETLQAETPDSENKKEEQTPPATPKKTLNKKK